MLRENGFSIDSKRGGRTSRRGGTKRFYGGTYTILNDIWATPEENDANGHRCTLNMVEQTKATEIDDVDGVNWTEYNWCGVRLFIGAVYWPPARSQGNKYCDLRYEKRVETTIKNMDTLCEYGIVILHGDLNATMGTEYVSKTAGKLKKNSHGRAWIKHLTGSRWRPIPNWKNKENRATYMRENCRSVLDHTIMDIRDLDLITDTDVWKIHKVLKADHAAIAVYLICPSHIEVLTEMNEKWEKLRGKPKSKRKTPPIHVIPGAEEKIEEYARNPQNMNKWANMAKEIRYIYDKRKVRFLRPDIGREWIPPKGPQTYIGRGGMTIRITIGYRYIRLTSDEARTRKDTGVEDKRTWVMDQLDGVATVLRLRNISRRPRKCGLTGDILRWKSGTGQTGEGIKAKWHDASSKPIHTHIAIAHNGPCRDIDYTWATDSDVKWIESQLKHKKRTTGNKNLKNPKYKPLIEGAYKKVKNGLVDIVEHVDTVWKNACANAKIKRSKGEKTDMPPMSIYSYSFQEWRMNTETEFETK